MKTPRKTTAPVATYAVRQGQSDHGFAQPAVAVLVPKGTHWRIHNAAVHKLAAIVEEATPAAEKWIVQTDMDRGVVYLELRDATADENIRGIYMLSAITQALSEGR